MSGLFENVLHVLYGALGAVGFALFFNAKKEKLVWAAVLGAINWTVYLITFKLTGSIFVSAFTATLAVALLSEVLARKLKAPSVSFYIPAIIPLIPGSSLYYMMEGMVQEDPAKTGAYAYSMLWTILGMGAGCAVVIGLVEMSRRVKQERR